MRTPLIGITTNRSADPKSDDIPSLPYRQVISEAYPQSVQRAGGIPVLIPFHLPPDQIRTMVSRLDGVILSGGGDISPDRFNGEPHPAVFNVDPVRDELEFALVKIILETGTPLLAICRGIQVLNVALGGTLYTDLHDQFSDQIKHNQWDDARDRLVHPVRVVENSLLKKAVQQDEIWVNSLHHQGIREAAPGLRPIAYAPDGLIEAVEYQAHPFCLGVQWHPECLPKAEPMQLIFRAFIQAAMKE